MNDKAINVSVFVPRNKRAHNISPEKNLFIRNFPASWSEPEVRKFIEEHFTQIGPVASVGICKDKSHEKFYAFVAYNNETDAKAAYEQLNNENVPGHDDKLYVNFAKSKRQFKLEQSQKFVQEPTNLYIKWLKDDVTEDELKSAFEEFGQTTSLCIRDNSNKTETSPSLKFAFINFMNSDDAKLA